MRDGPAMQNGALSHIQCCSASLAGVTGFYSWLSAAGLSALSVLRIEGGLAATFLAARGWRESARPRRLLLKDAGGEALDEVMVAPELGGYTVTCHGGPAVRAALERELEGAGFVRVDPWQAPLFGAAHRLARETLRQLTRARGLRAVEYCLWALKHGETALLRVLRQPSGLEDLLHRSAAMRHLFEPLRVHLWGPVNAGKSSLLNALCGEELAQTGDEPGLTRDVIEGSFEHQGWVIHLLDNPGEWSGGHDLDRQALQWARSQRQSGDVVLHLVPPGAAPPRAEAPVVYSRCDEFMPAGLPESGFPLAVSVKIPSTLERLKDALVALQRPEVSPASGDALVLSEELRDDLRQLAQGQASREALERKWLAPGE
ncbi:hypothetical protein EDM80_05335 [bacterium]|nr:MAG: hypothetical protein EDM80_05335 [bacterium]RIK64370.1 MAG: hypothetical protein DCC64_04340 [Planctomycetota bacterium]